MRKNLIIFGTRPEAIKMAPLIKEFNNHPDFQTKVCVTAQHREMLDQVLDFFDLKPDYDLNLMRPNQNLYSLTADIITQLKTVLEDFVPNFVYVHGDTTTSMAASIAAFYSGSKVCHIEAGLRTNNKLSPFPEEINRQITSRIADYHFAPTEISRQNLLNEGISKDDIIITGNTVIDALLISKERVANLNSKEINSLKNLLNSDKKTILVTGHRRENHGEGFINICEALKQIALEFPDVQIVYPVHLNPHVRKPVYEILSEIKNIFLILPLSYPAFVWMMKECYIIITDSGGVQEEAPSLGKPVLVLRDTTERPEAVQAGTVILVGTDKKKIVNEVTELLKNKKRYAKMAELQNPYGDGKACKRIVNYMQQIF
ncbi:UDP-N-acetylglucosamine 2-epimerase (non-hydrolyzing) [Chryseobacterium lacus]|uniref:UDP-N-acetylglucosamine 2-epimerase (non-hydrolyzing) n=1 Tax=Chryseobacterium lacus TaxID=2058346 RepID=A0A368MWQ9_9FLAO|nr:UDP-N-acetylglucosamine 2-epimerase (non-hydrolyzing) [Chryseobacterium lacus]RCU42598.1 UDP-N-acetylglucosamine 2-epimerase (non-hydrolyzing) [Chryseobacterium lacus]RST27153.1 UDP-N-acetylglucosamine 2-epimerase (non-hydrolyzing) [Chryseobacterium lacus]